MAIRATNVAFRDFIKHALPTRSVLQHGAYASGFLASDVIELHHDGVHQAAVDAWFALKVCQQQLAIPVNVTALVDIASAVVLCTIAGVVPAAIFPLARLAV
jgi:hypothetical protein